LASSLPVVLLVEGDVSARRQLARALRPKAVVRVAASPGEARAQLESSPISGVILELPEAAPDAALGFLQSLRAQGSRLPLLVVSDTRDVLHASRVSGLGAWFASKAEGAALVTRRALELAEAARVYRVAREGIARRLATRHALTAAETETLIGFLEGGNRDGLADGLGIAESSLKSRVRGVCRKLRIPRIEVVYRLLFEASLAG
jgi:DNA-binding response OmpR family regulator